jgi:low temperature requirement protein LtrA
VKRIRQVTLALLGLFYVGLLYPLYTDLSHSKWLIEMHNEECEPMFLTFFVTLGVFLLLAASNPMKYRLVVAFAAWHSLAHSATMLIQTVEAYSHGVQRDYRDVILFGIIGIVVLVIVPSKEEAAARV